MAQAAANRNHNHEEEQIEKLRKARRLQELFHGRFSQEETIKILQFTNWDLQDGVNFLFESEQQAIRDVLGGEEEVSRCYTCRVKYDALPRDLEWGWAKFQCQCGNEFHGFGAMNKTYSGCYRCQHYCLPFAIIPPFRRREGRRSRQRHSCSAQNCYRRTPPGPHEPPINLCVHPNSLRRKVVEPSQRHTSTGSTVKTFLTQDELISECDYEPSLADISELDEEDGDNR